MPIALTILGIVIVSLLLGTLLNFTSVFLAIPLIFIYFGGLMGSEAFQRQKRISQLKRFRRDAKAKKFEFDEDDKRTIALGGAREAGPDRLLGVELPGLARARVPEGVPAEPLAVVLREAVRHGGGQLHLLPAGAAQGGGQLDRADAA